MISKDYYFCMTKGLGFRNISKHNFQYTNLPSACSSFSWSTNFDPPLVTLDNCMLTENSNVNSSIDVLDDVNFATLKLIWQSNLNEPLRDLNLAIQINPFHILLKELRSGKFSEGPQNYFLITIFCVFQIITWQHISRETVLQLYM